MASLLERLAQGEVLVGDGAMGTMLIERGLKLGECPERWNLDRPEVLSEIARLYAEAGADMVETNTFGGSPLKLAQYGLDGRTEEINASAVRAARLGVGHKVMLAASIGPSGRLLKPYGDTDQDEMRASFTRQLRAVLDEGIDAVVIETMTDLTEASLAIQAAKTLDPSLPVIATMTFDATPRGFFTMMGVSVEQAAERLSSAGADVIGSNCGNGIDNMVRIAAEFRRFSARPVIIQANAGLPRIENGVAVYPESPEFMAGRVPALLDIGVNIVGGCCGTTPTHVNAIYRSVRQYFQK